MSPEGILQVQIAKLDANIFMAFARFPKFSHIVKLHAIKDGV